MRLNLVLLILLLNACGSDKTKLPKSELPNDSAINNEAISDSSILDVKSHSQDIKTNRFQEGSTDAVSIEEQIRLIYDEALLNGQCYQNLDFLANQIGGRLSGSPQAAAAVEWAYQTMDTTGIEKVWKQDVMVPRWIRGDKEILRVSNSVSRGSFSLNACALGGSIATAKNGITAEVIEVKYFNELEKLGKENIEGKIIFFNRKMDARFINTFYAYSGCVEQRWAGAAKAAKYGAVAVIVRSMTLAQDDFPHTGSMGYEDGITKIPAASISTNSADVLSAMLKEQNDLKIYFKQNCKTLPDVLSHNVIGEIKGSEFPDEIIVVGGHLDSWDIGDGAHDDGAGCVQSIEVLRIIQALGIKPKRTIRAVMFMNEENGLRGGTKYADVAATSNQKHIAAIETDRGGFAPDYFTVENMSEKQLMLLESWLPLLKEYGISAIKQGGSGADISPLKPQGTVLMGLVPESQRYFDYHHCAKDKFEAVNKRELELGAAAMAALVWLISENGI